MIRRGHFICTVRKIRSKHEILDRFSARMGAAKIDDYLEQWTSVGIMYREGERFLSLAPAMDARSAAKRIRKMAAGWCY